MLSPLTDLVGECGHTKATQATKTTRTPWHWDDMHQTAFENIKTAIAKDDVLAFPDYSQGFEINTDSSKFQLETVITKKQATGIFQPQTEYSTAKIHHDQTRTTCHSENTKRVQRHAMGSNYHSLYIP